MPWIECHHDFFDHPKTLELASLLKCSEERAAVGLLRFWVWCLDYVPDGDLRRHAPAHIARAFRLPASKGEMLVSAMIESGWLDLVPYFRVHNWWRHAGIFLQNRHKREPEVWRKIRSLYEGRPEVAGKPEILPEMVEKVVESAGTARVQNSCSMSAAPDNLTRPDLTVPDRTKQDHHLRPLIPLLRAKGGGGGGGFDDLKANIFRKAGVRYLSDNDEAKLKFLYSRHGRETFEACDWLHSGVMNVPAYLKAVLEKQSRLEMIAERARRLLQAEGKEAQ